MKDGVEATAVSRAVEPEEYANRKLIRPTLARAEHVHVTAPSPDRERERAPRQERSERPPRNDHSRNDHGGSRKGSPQEQTNAENFYYQKQIQAKTPMVVTLRSGEELHGVIEWYDRCCLKLSREGSTNILVYKTAIKYIYKEGENSR